MGRGNLAGYGREIHQLPACVLHGGCTNFVRAQTDLHSIRASGAQIRG